MDKSNMHNLEAFLEYGMHEILWDLGIQSIQSRLHLGLNINLHEEKNNSH